MSYVIYEISSTYIFRHPRTRREYYVDWGNARAAMTRNKLDENIWAIAESKEFHEKIEKTKIVHNLMSGQPVELSVNTPRCCDPSSELYWSM